MARYNAPPISFADFLEASNAYVKKIEDVANHLAWHLTEAECWKIWPKVQGPLRYDSVQIICHYDSIFSDELEEENQTTHPFWIAWEACGRSGYTFLLDLRNYRNYLTPLYEWYTKTKRRAEKRYAALIEEQGGKKTKIED